MGITTPIENASSDVLELTVSEPGSQNGLRGC